MSRYTHQTILYVGPLRDAFNETLGGLTKKWLIDGQDPKFLTILSLDDPCLGNTAFQPNDTTRLYILGHGTEKGEKICAEFSGGLFTLNATELADRLRIFLRNTITSAKNPVKINLLMCMGAHTPAPDKNSFAENLLLGLHHLNIHTVIIARTSLLGINKHTGRKQTFTEDCKKRFLEKKASFFFRSTAGRELIHRNLEPSRKVCLTIDEQTIAVKKTLLAQKNKEGLRKNADELIILLNAFIESATRATKGFSFFVRKKQANAEVFIQLLVDTVRTQQFETLPALLENAKHLNLPHYLLEDLKNFDLTDEDGAATFHYSSLP